MKNKNGRKDLSSLRKQAEKKLKEQMERLKKLSALDVRDLVHELGTHQIELEMQNEELRRSREELEISSSRYAELYDFAPVGYFTVDSEGLIREANLTGAHLVGIERGLLRNKPFVGFIAEAEDRKIYFKYREELLRKEGKHTCEIRLRKKDGTILYAQLQSTTGETIDGDDGSVRTAILDITDSKRSEEALFKAGSLQRAIFNSANFSIIATDAKGVIQIFNVGAERMLGYTAGDVMNKITPADISDPQEVVARAEALSVELGTPITPGFEALVFKASRGIEDIYELTYLRKDGSRLPAMVSVTALRDARDIIGYLLIGTDNTARKQVEEERRKLDQALQEKNVELERAKAAAEKANFSKSEFLSSMSHELRSPLNAILGFAQLMEESDSPPPTPDQKKSLDRMLQAGWHLLTLINEILDLAKIESGKLSLSPESVSLAEVMAECQGVLEGQAQKRGVHMTFPQFNIPCYVHADRTRLKQILINFLSNSIKYNRAQGTVEVQYAASAPGRIRISIKDTGPGLPPEKVAQLFQPFNRLGQEAGGEEGTGIGLVVAKQLIELMGGVVGVESAVGKGSVFWFELMAAAKPQGIVENDGSKAPQVHVQSQAPVRTLLYVEDNPANLELVEQIIARRPGLRLLSAATGKLGIELARTTQPEVILMDINLPDINGIEVMSILRNNPSTAHIPIVAISANAMPDDIKKGLQAGFFRYITKPIKVKEFMETLATALEFAEKGLHNVQEAGPVS